MVKFTFYSSGNGKSWKGFKYRMLDVLIIQNAENHSSHLLVQSLIHSDETEDQRSRKHWG
jgi:hypothetical protein